MAEIKIYTTGSCPSCVLAKEILSAKGAAFQEVNLDGKAEERDELMKRTGMRTVPQIFINGQLIGGCSDMIAMDQKGKLDVLLGADTQDSDI